jgi:DNA-binding NarL/FixJ family response regulator
LSDVIEDGTELERTLLRMAAELEAGNIEGARQGLHEARKLAVAGGASFARQVRQALDTTRELPSPAPTSGLVATLTPSELRVVELAAAGMTNREIGEALYVTVKAVEWHLSNAYPKLGVRGRGELAAILDRG